MEAGGLAFFNTLYEVLKSRPDLFITALLLFGYLAERAERKTQTKGNSDLASKMHKQNQETNESLNQIKFLLEILTKGRF